MLGENSRYVIRARSPLVIALVVALGACALGDLWMGASAMVEVAVMPDWEQRTEAGDLTALMFALSQFVGGLASVFSTLASIVLFCVWIYGANVNARALGASSLSVTPGWSVGWWFVPFANLIKPYRVMRELYEATPPRDGKPRSFVDRASWVFPVWWGTWLLNNFASNLIFRMSLSDAPDLRGASGILTLLSTPLGVVAAVTAALVVHGVHARQVAASAERDLSDIIQSLS